VNSRWFSGNVTDKMAEVRFPAEALFHLCYSSVQTVLDRAQRAIQWDRKLDMGWLGRCNGCVEVRMNRENEVRFPAGAEVFLFLTTPKPRFGPKRSHILFVPGPHPPGNATDHSSASKAEFTTSRAMPLLIPLSSWRR